MRMLVGAAMIVAMAAPAMAGDIPPGASTMARLQLGEPNAKFGVFDYNGDQDAFRIRLDAGQNYALAASSSCNSRALTLFDRGFRPIAAAKPSDSDQNSAIEYIPKYTGLYFLQVTDKGVSGEPGCDEEPVHEYRIWAAKSCAPNRRTECAYHFGKTTERFIWAWTDRDWWSVSIPKTGVYTIVGEGGSAMGWTWGGTLGLRRADTSVITESGRGDGFQCTLGEACLRAKLPAGKYFVTLRMPELHGQSQYRLTITPEE